MASHDEMPKRVAPPFILMPPQSQQPLIELPSTFALFAGAAQVLLRLMLVWFAEEAASARRFRLSTFVMHPSDLLTPLAVKRSSRSSKALPRNGSPYLG